MVAGNQQVAGKQQRLFDGLNAGAEPKHQRQGIGFIDELHLGAEGARTIVTDIKQELLDDIAAEFKGKGWDGRQYLCDITKSGQIQAMVADVDKVYGRIDILVNNAGIARNGTVQQLSPASAKRLARIAPVFC